MTPEPDFLVRDLAQTALAVRKDVTISPRLDGEEAGYVIEDKANSKFFRIGVPEYTFISLLDGKTTVEEALSIVARVEPEYAFTIEEGAAICRWLVDNNLVVTTKSCAPAGSGGNSSSESEGADPAKWNPLFLRIPLLRPERLLGRLEPWTSWVFSRPAVVVTTVLFALAAYQILTHWDRFQASSRGILSEGRWLWLALGWLGIKVLHEMAHGIVCRRYGGLVREAGVVLILAAPVAYVDVTSSWRFRCKWERIHTALAGMYLELLVASLAALAWSSLRPGVLSDFCFQLMILASVTTVLFNANPLMRFDGYYVLSDLVEIPNLASRAQQILLHLVRRFLLGVESHRPRGGWKVDTLLGVYGVAALAWRIMVCCGIALAAANLFHGAGIALALIGVLLWVAPPVTRAVKYFIHGTTWEQPRRLRIVLVGGGLCAALVTAAVWLPWPTGYRAPGIVEYAPLSVVRAARPGFVREVRVRPGQVVAAGQVLVVMENERLALEVADLRLRVSQSAGRVRGLLYDEKTAASQSEREELESLKEQLLEREAELDSLTLRAPVDGTVVAHDLDSIRGTYLERGAALLTIGTEDHKELHVSIAQEDVDVYAEHVSRPLRVRIRGESGFAATLLDVTPRGSVKPFNTALCAPLGGPLAVRRLDADHTSDEQESQYELLTPRFRGRVTLDREQSLSLLAGQRGVVSLGSGGRSLAQHLTSRLRHWLRARSGDLPQVL